MTHTLKILSITPVTHNVHCLRLEKPTDYSYIPGQATEVAINKPGWTEQKRPFTFTSLNDDPYLEFTIKSYTDHDGVTNQIGMLKAGDELILDDAWGAIEYKGEGYFIAGGAGITPFIAILRQLHKDGTLADNKLFFSNKTTADIIYKEELGALLGDNAVFIITDKSSDKQAGYIDAAFIATHVQDFSKHFYVCGPDPMIQAINDILVAKGAAPDAVVFEK
jgi:ferredoxin-NADP reductase